MRHPAWPALLALAVLHYTLVPNAYADTSGRANAGAAARSFSSQEGRDYAAREAAGHAGDFVGGQDTTTDNTFDPVVFVLVLTGVIVFALLIVALAASADASSKGTHAAPPVQVIWTCPSCGGSHGQAGNCPQCGMTLIRK